LEAKVPKFFLKFAAVCLLAITPAVALGKDLSVEELRAAQSKMKSSDALTVDFVQTKYSGLRGKSTRREGRALFVKPNLFKWMLQTPSKEFKIYDGKSFYDFSPDAATAKRYAPNGAQAQELRQVIDLVLNVDTLLKRYDLVKAEEVGDLIKIRLSPKSPGDLVGIELHFAKKEEFISYLKMDLNNKNSLIHEFKNPSRAAIPASAFALPAGVKITDSI
jgi:outer membrane lipoprotein-sorting protein